MGIAGDIAVVVVAAFAGGWLAQRLGQPLILGYILAGIAIGPYTGGVTLSDPQQIEHLAEIGVALLLFALGLEFSLRELVAVGRVALLGTPLQVALAALLGFAIGRLLGWPGPAAAWLGGAAALSSTLVVLKVLAASGETDTRPGRIMIGMLIMQDLLAVPMLILLPRLGDLAGGAAALGVVALRGVVLVALLVYVGGRFIPRLMAQIGRWQSRELFLVAVTAIGLGVAYGTWRAGLSFAFGAFLAGLVIGESVYSHQALGDILPLRDIFGMLFFVSVGMLIDPAFVLSNLGAIVAVAAAIMGGKGLAVWLAVRGAGHRAAVAVPCALGLCGLGEFSFVFVREGVHHGMLTAEHAALALSVTVLSMVATPQLMSAAPLLVRRLHPGGPSRRDTLAAPPPAGTPPHVVVLGLGRVGGHIADVLDSLAVPYVAVDIDPDRVAAAHAAGRRAIFGDAASPTVLAAAGIADARVVVAALSSAAAVRSIASTVLAKHPGLPVVARAMGAQELDDLRLLGVDHVVQPEYEGSVAMVRAALEILDVPDAVVDEQADEVHEALYGGMGMETNATPAP